MCTTSKGEKCRVKTSITECMAFISLPVQEFRPIFIDEYGGSTNPPGGRISVRQTSCVAVHSTSASSGLKILRRTSGRASIHCETFAAGSEALICR